jgi:hypothetical protein
MLHSGIDLHKQTLAIAAVDPAGHPARDVQLPTRREALRRYCASLPEAPADQRAVVESTSNWYRFRDLLRARLQLVGQQTRCKNTITGLLAQHNVAAPAALPPLVQLRVRLLHEQLTLLGEQAKRLAAELHPVLIPTPDVQRLLWIPGIGRVVAFTVWLDVDGIGRLASARDFVSYCRLVPGAGNSGGRTRHRRAKDGNRYLKLALNPPSATPPFRRSSTSPRSAPSTAPCVVASPPSSPAPWWRRNSPASCTTCSPSRRRSTGPSKGSR